MGGGCYWEGVEEEDGCIGAVHVDSLSVTRSTPLLGRLKSHEGGVQYQLHALAQEHRSLVTRLPPILQLELPSFPRLRLRSHCWCGAALEAPRDALHRGPCSLLQGLNLVDAQGRIPHWQGQQWWSFLCTGAWSTGAGGTAVVPLRAWVSTGRGSSGSPPCA